MTVAEIKERLFEAQLQAHILAMAVEPGELQGRLESLAGTLSLVAEKLDDDGDQADQAKLDALERGLDTTEELLAKVTQRAEQAVQVE